MHRGAHPQEVTERRLGAVLARMLTKLESIRSQARLELQRQVQGCLCAAALAVDVCGDTQVKEPL